jgi:hypothetical protein
VAQGDICITGCAYTKWRDFQDNYLDVFGPYAAAGSRVIHKGEDYDCDQAFEYDGETMHEMSYAPARCDDINALKTAREMLRDGTPSLEELRAVLGVTPSSEG